MTSEKPLGWIGVDFDGTLAWDDVTSENDTPGPPIEPMVKRVREWRQQGYEVRIVTARASLAGQSLQRQVNLINRWCLQHIGEILPVTCSKDFQMLQLWDDRAISVESNTGRVTCDLHKDYECPLRKPLLTPPSKS